MPQSTLTTKGQVTLPVSVRRALRLESGDRIDFVEVAEGRFEVIAATRSIKELKGIISDRERHPVSIEDMNAAIAAEGAGTR